MIDANWIDNQLCWVCSFHEPHRTACQETGLMDEQGQWVGGFARWKSEKLRKVTEQLMPRFQKRCLRIGLDCEWGLICRDCLQKWLDDYD